MVRGILHFLLSQEPSPVWPTPAMPLQPVRYFEHAGDWLGLEAFVRSHLESQPLDTWGWQLLGEALSLQGKHEEAIEIFREGLSIHPNDPWALLGLGCAFMRQDSLDAALAVFREAQHARADFPEITYDLGQIYAKAGKSGLALHQFRELVLKDPNDAKSWLALGRLYLNTTSQLYDSDTGFQECYSTLQELDLDLSRQLLKDRLFRKQAPVEHFSE